MDDHVIEIGRGTDARPVNREILHLDLAAEGFTRPLLGSPEEVSVKAFTVQESNNSQQDDYQQNPKSTRDRDGNCLPSGRVGSPDSHRLWRFVVRELRLW